MPWHDAAVPATGRSNRDLQLRRDHLSGLDREVRGQLLEDRPNQQGCLVQFFQDAFLIPYVAIVELNEQRCPRYPRLSKEDITIDFLPQL